MKKNKISFVIVLGILMLSLSSQALAETEPNNNYGSPNAISLDSPVTGKISSQGDVDWFTITTDTIGDLTITQTEWPGYIETRIAVFGPNDPSLAQNNPVTSAAPGTYYIKVWSANDGFSDVQYKFSASLKKASTGNDIDGGKDSASGAVPINMGTPVSDTIAPSKATAGKQDIDWFTITTDTIGDLTITQTEWPGYIETRIAVFGPNNPSLSQNNPVTSAAPGTYYIKVWSANDGSSIAPYKFSATIKKAVTGNDIDGGKNSPSGAVSINSGTDVSDTIAPSKETAGQQDVDWYTLTTNAAGDLTVTQTEWPGYIETRIAVFGPNDPALAQNNPVKNAAPGTYYIKVWSANDGSSIIPYKFNVDARQSTTTTPVSMVTPQGTAMPAPTSSATPCLDFGLPGGTCLFSNGNIGGVSNNPTSSPTFTLTNTYQILSITDYHWNSARGAAPGTISLKDSAGKTYGPWSATTRPGQGGVPNAYWDVKPNIVLGPGTYTVIDSDTATWSHNSESKNVGMSIVKGTLVSSTPSTTPCLDFGIPGGTCLFSNGNIGGVSNNPTSSPTFTLTNTYQILSITDYHWNSARGAAPGTISLKDSSGKTYGPWSATTRPGQGGVPNAYWDVKPNIVLGPGTYTVIDSDTATWSHNSESKNVGMSIIKGTLISSETTSIAGTPSVVGAYKCEGTQPYIYIEERKMDTGKTVEIPVIMCNAANLANMDITLNYDSSVIKIKDVIKGSLNAKSMFDWNPVSAGKLKLSFASNDGVSGSGSIAVLIFDVTGKTGAQSSITGTVTTASKTDGGKISLTVNPGKFSVETSAIKGDCDGDNELTERDALAALQMSVEKRALNMCYDYNGDGSVDSSDARDILKSIVAKGA